MTKKNVQVLNDLLSIIQVVSQFLLFYSKYYNYYIFTEDEDSREQRLAAKNCILAIRLAVLYREKTRELSRKRLRSEVRAFKVAEIDFTCTSYPLLTRLKSSRIPDHKVPGWEQPPYEYYFSYFTLNFKGKRRWELLTEPPATMDLAEAQLDMIVEDPTSMDIWAPCHSQSVEHGVAITSQVVTRWRTPETQLGAALQVHHARKATPGEVTHKSRRLMYEGVKPAPI